MAAVEFALVLPLLVVLLFVFEPVQPYLAAVGIVALAYAFHKRITTADSCELPVTNEAVSR